MKLISKQLMFLVLGGILAARSGTVSGVVLDAATQRPLAGANIILEHTSRGTVTGADGAFRLTAVSPGRHTLTISMIGYSPTTVTCDSSPGPDCSFSIYLRPIVLESNLRITVSGERGENGAFHNIRETNLSTTENMISLLEGVSLIRRGNYAQEPVLRGLSGGQINITINGMKSYGACTDRMDPVSSYVEAEALNSVEIGKGSVSLIHGATVGGSVNMTFLPPEISPQPHNAWFIKGGWRNVVRERKLTGSWQLKTPKQGLTLNGTYRQALDYSDAEGKTIPFTGYEKFSVNLGVLKQVNTTTRLMMEIIGDDAWNVGYASLPMDVGYARMRMVGVSLQRFGLRPYLPRLEWKVYINGVDHRMDDSRRRDLFMNMPMDMPGRTRTAGTYLDLVISRNGKGFLTLRSDFFWNSSYAEMTMFPANSRPMKIVTWPDMHRWNVGQYVGFQRLLTTQTTIKSALRYDFYYSAVYDPMGINLLQITYPDHPLSRKDVLFTGNLSLVHRFGPAWQATVLVARGSRVPTVTEAYGYYLYVPTDGYLYLGNPDLPSENSIQFEFRNLITTDRLEFTANLFHYFFRNFIVGSVMDTTNALGYARGWKSYTGGGRAILSGAEATLTYQLNSAWVLVGGLNFQEGRLTDLHDYIPMIAPLEAHASLTWNQKSFWVQIATRGAGKQERYSRLGGENFTPAFMVYSIKAGYRVGRGIHINLEVDNMTNRTYHEHLDWGDIHRPGRNILFSCTFSG